MSLFSRHARYNFNYHRINSVSINNTLIEDQYQEIEESVLAAVKSIVRELIVHYIG